MHGMRTRGMTADLPPMAAENKRLRAERDEACGRVAELEGKLNTIAAAYNHISSPSGTNDPMELVLVIRQILEDGK